MTRNRSFRRSCPAAKILHPLRRPGLDKVRPIPSSVADWTDFGSFLAVLTLDQHCQRGSQNCHVSSRKSSEQAALHTVNLSIALAVQACPLDRLNDAVEAVKARSGGLQMTWWLTNNVVNPGHESGSRSSRPALQPHRSLPGLTRQSTPFGRTSHEEDGRPGQARVMTDS